MNNFLIYLLQSGINLSVLYMIYWLFMRKDTFFKLNRYYLLLSAGISLLLPLINIKLTVDPEETTYLYLLNPVIVTPDKVAHSISGSLNLSQILLILYLTVLSVLLFRFLYQCSRILLLIRKFGIQKHNGLNIVFTNSDYSPFSFFNLIFLSDAIADSEQLDQIITHEKIHIKQRHTIDLVILEMISMLQWFNPVVWFYRRTIRHIHEFLADEGVLAKGVKKIDYQKMLVNQIFGMQVNYLSNNFNHSQLKRRLSMMSRTKTNRLALLKMAFVVPLAVTLTFMFSVSITERIIAQEKTDKVEQKTTQNNSEKQKDSVYVVVKDMPSFPGGDAARMKFLTENIKYPELARKKGIQGRVFVTFVVEKDGQISNIKVLRGIGGGCDEEAVRVISMMPKWKPGIDNGKPVRFQFNLPIKFSLDNNKKKINKSDQPKGTVAPIPQKSK